MFCKNCGEAMAPNQAICLKCGVKTGDGNSFCANCGKPVAPNAAVCLNCGVAIGKGGATGVGGDLAGKDKTTMALICFFLGGIGIHNFMMGETKKGIFKIIMSLCFYLGSIFALIDFIKILMGTYVVDPNKLI